MNAAPNGDIHQQLRQLLKKAVANAEQAAAAAEATAAEAVQARANVAELLAALYEIEQGDPATTADERRCRKADWVAHMRELGLITAVTTGSSRATRRARDHTAAPIVGGVATAGVPKPTPGLPAQRDRHLDLHLPAAAQFHLLCRALEAR